MTLRTYGPLKVLLMSMNTDDLMRQDVAATQDVADLKAELRGDFADLRAEFAVLRGDFADLRVEMREAINEQTRTYITCMIGLLTAYTVMSGSLVAIAAIIISR